jgi:hypothetical protein
MAGNNSNPRIHGDHLPADGQSPPPAVGLS